MTFKGRLAVVIVSFVVAVGLVVWTVATLLTPGYPSVDFTKSQPAGQPVNLTVQTVAAIGYGAHPTWVSYLVKQPNGTWVQATTWKLPAHTVVHMTVEQYDGGGPLRNQFFGKVTGVHGGAAQVTSFVAGKQVGTTRSMNLIDSNATITSDPLTNGVGHTFAIPSLNIEVPLPAVSGTSSTACSSAAPCSPTTTDHNQVSFSFTTPGPGNYSWQCFVPCGLGYLFGNGGPMSTLNYMGGFIDVVGS